MGGRDKRYKALPKVGTSPSPRQPASATQPAGRMPVASPADAESHLRFRFTDIDHGGSWELSKIARADHAHLLKKLKHYEGMSVKDAKRTGALADYDMAKCPNKQATKRLAEQFEGRDDLSRLKISGQQRLLGFRVGNEFSIVWWDPAHEVWPS